MSPTLRTVYHVSAFSWYVFIIRSMAARAGQQLPPGIFVYGGPWKYLTFLNLLLQMLYFGLAVVTDLPPRKKTDSTLSKCKDLIFTVFAFPVGMFVVIFFWTVFAYDRELVYPASIDAFFPPWMNHAMHSAVLPVLLGEVLVQPHVYTKTRNALALLGAVGLTYLSWIIWVYLSAGIWVYPLLGHFSSFGLVLLFFFNMTLATFLYLLGEKLNSLVWGKIHVNKKSQ